MKHKSLYLLSILSSSLLLQTNVTAAPLVSIGDNIDIFFAGSTSLQWTSNVFRDEHDEEDDLIWSISPGFEINLGRGASSTNFRINTRYDIIRYQDNDQLDTELFHINAVGSYKSSRLDLNGSVSFDENKSSSGSDNVIKDLIEYDTFGAALHGEYRLSPKFSFGAGAKYEHKEYQTFEDRFADTETISFPFDVFYELTPKVDLSLGYTYRETETEDTLIPNTPPSGLWTDGYDSDQHFFNIGARGNLLPKLSGFFKIGYRLRSADDSTRRIVFIPGPGSAPFASVNRGDTSMLGLDADLVWTATPKLTARLGLSRDFGVGGEGGSTENSSVNLSGNYSMNSKFAATAKLGYTLRDYVNRNREDKQYEAGIALFYTPNQYWRFGTGYTYSENDTNATNRSYEEHIFNISASLRY